MNISFREAQENDLSHLVSMLADDELGAKREVLSQPLNQSYIEAFILIDKDPNNELIVVEYSNQLIGMLQLTFIPYLTYIGSWRCLIEGVRIHSEFRGQGLGEQIFRWVIDRAKEKKCQLIQLTSDKQRPDALRFYEKIGFVATHEGFKLKL